MPQVNSRSKANLAQLLRVGVVIALLWLLPSPVRDLSGLDGGEPPTVDRLHGVIPDAMTIDEDPSREGLWSVRDANGEQIASVARTLPLAADVIGYRGPSEAFIVVDNQLVVLGTGLIESADTAEHVEAVARDGAFFDQFIGWTWGDVNEKTIDGVTSATLTSLALANGIVKRMGGDRPSLVFPDELESSEVKRWFAEASALQTNEQSTVVLDANGNELGRVVRTGSYSDDVMGYQGPTELLLWIDDSDVVQRAMLRSSFDNQPYVRYCKTEYGFWARFKEKSLSQLATMDIEAEGIEGVSGATMTSLAIAETLVASAQAYQAQKEAPPVTEDRLDMRWSIADFACLGILLLSGILRQAGWFRRDWIRRLWLLLVVLVIGLWAGNLMSMALVAGWGAEGIAWRLAPGLTAVAAVAFLLPPLWKSNPYCNHLCPHGADPTTGASNLEESTSSATSSAARASSFLGARNVAGCGLRHDPDSTSHRPCFMGAVPRSPTCSGSRLLGHSYLRVQRFSSRLLYRWDSAAWDVRRVGSSTTLGAMHEAIGFNSPDAVAGVLLLSAIVTAWVRSS